VTQATGATTGRLDGRVALVTGSSRGIGEAIARRFHAEGARVALTWRTNEERARALAAELDGALCLELDVRSRTSVRRAVETTRERLGGLDVLVNNAGYLKQQPFFEITDEDWDLTLETNLKGVFLCTQEAGRILEAQGSGSIVNVSSIGGQFGGPKAPHYSASKAAVLAFTRSTARLFAPSGVRVNAIAPGFVRTDMYDAIVARTPAPEILAQIPLGTLGETEDVANAALYLASDESRFVTGEVMNVNGGQWMG